MEFKFHYRLPDAKIEAECGKGGHKALAKWFAGYSKQDSINEFLKHYRAISEEHVPTDSGWDWSNAKEIIEYWMDTHPVETFPFEVVVDQIESGIKVPLSNGVEFFALIDAPVIDKATRGQYPLDHKFTGKISSWWLVKFRLSSQLTGYAWALGVANNVTVPGIYLNAIEIWRLPSSNRKCSTHGVKYSECRLQHTKFQLSVTQRDPEVTFQWHKQAIHLANYWGVWKEAITDIGQIAAAPMEGVFNNGCTFCQFKNFCQAGRPGGLAEGMYEKAVWRPWDGLFGEKVEGGT
jgi:hypothetical protein